MRKYIRNLLLLAVLFTSLVSFSQVVKAESTRTIKVGVNLSEGDNQREVTFRFTSDIADSIGQGIEIQTEFNYKFSNKPDTGVVKTGSKLTLSSGDELIIENVPSSVGWFITPTAKPGYQCTPEVLYRGTATGSSTFLAYLTSDKNESGKTGNITIDLDTSKYQYKAMSTSFSERNYFKLKITDPNGNELKNHYKIYKGNSQIINNGATPIYKYDALDYTEVAPIKLMSLPVGTKIEIESTRKDIELIYNPIVIAEGEQNVTANITQALRDVTFNLDRDENMYDSVVDVGFTLKPDINYPDAIPCSSSLELVGGNIVDENGTTTNEKYSPNKKYTMRLIDSNVITFKNVPCGYSIEFDVSNTEDYTVHEIGRHTLEMYIEKNPSNTVFNKKNSMTLTVNRNMKTVLVSKNYGENISGVIYDKAWKYRVLDTDGNIVKDKTYKHGNYKTTYTGTDSMKLPIVTGQKRLIMPRNYKVEFIDLGVKGYDIKTSGDANDNTLTSDTRSLVLNVNRKTTNVWIKFEVEEGIDDLNIGFKWQDPVYEHITEYISGKYKLNGKDLDSGTSSIRLNPKDKDYIEFSGIPSVSQLSLVDGGLGKYTVSKYTDLDVPESGTGYTIKISKKSSTPIIPENPKTHNVTIEYMVEDYTENVPLLKVFLSKDKEGKEPITEEFKITSKEFGNGILKPGFSIKPKDGSMVVESVTNGYYVNIVPDSTEYYSVNVSWDKKLDEDSKVSVVIRSKKVTVDEIKEDNKKTEETTTKPSEGKKELVRTGESILAILLAVLFIGVACLLKRISKPRY